MTAVPGVMDRRGLLAAALTLVAMPAVGAAGGLPAEVEAAIRDQVGRLADIDGGMTFRLPETAENGAFVPVQVMVHSAMEGADRCIAIHVFATRNPTPGVASYRFGRGVARAEVGARIRLAEGQTVIAYAEMSDGSLRMAAARVAVTTGGCLT